MEENKNIAPEFINDYNFLMKCNNIIVSIMEMSDKEQFSSEKIEKKPKDKKKFDSGKYSIEYFRTHGYSKAINKAYYKHLILSVVSDTSKSIYDAINCAGICHINSAYTLLRKPLKDNLLIMEMLITKTPKFLNRFLNRPIEEYAIDRITRNKSKTKRIIREANKCIKTSIPHINPSLLYKIRYDDKDKYSFQRIWNKTSHIITTSPHYKTEKGNLNMIFNDEEHLEKFIGYFYKTLPNLYFYIIKLFEYFLYNEKLISEEEYLLNTTLVGLSYFNLIFGTEIDWSLLEDISFPCPYCHEPLDVSNFEHKNSIIELIKIQQCFCPYCLKKIHSDRFIFYRKYD